MRTLSLLRKKHIDVTKEFDPYLLKENHMPGIDEIIKTINECFTIGADKAIKRGEISKGYEIVNPGQYRWFNCWEFYDAILSKDGRAIRIVAVIAKNPGTGAFSRLVSGICAEGLKPVVVTPLPEMEAILRGWRWRGVVTPGSYSDREAQWWPSDKWIKERAQRCVY